VLVTSRAQQQRFMMTETSHWNVTPARCVGVPIPQGSVPKGRGPIFKSIFIDVFEMIESSHPLLLSFCRNCYGFQVPRNPKSCAGRDGARWEGDRGSPPPVPENFGAQFFPNLENLLGNFLRFWRNMLDHTSSIWRKFDFGESYWTIFSNFVYSHFSHAILCTKIIVSKIERRINFFLKVRFLILIFAYPIRRKPLKNALLRFKMCAFYDFKKRFFEKPESSKMMTPKNLLYSKIKIFFWRFFFVKRAHFNA